MMHRSEIKMPVVYIAGAEICDFSHSVQFCVSCLRVCFESKGCLSSRKHKTGRERQYKRLNLSFKRSCDVQPHQSYDVLPLQYLKKLQEEMGEGVNKKLPCQKYSEMLSAFPPQGRGGSKTHQRNEYGERHLAACMGILTFLFIYVYIVGTGVFVRSWKSNLRLGFESLWSFWCHLDLMASIPFLQWEEVDAS